MVAEEGGRDGVFRQPLLEQGRDVGVAPARLPHVGAEYLLDVAAALRDGEEEEAVDVRCAVVGDLVEVGPGLAHDVAVGADGPRRLAEPGEEVDVPLALARVVARHGVEAEAVHAHVLEPEAQDALYLGPHLRVIEVEVRHGVHEAALIIAPARFGVAVARLIRPVVIPAVLGVHVRLRAQEPGVLAGGVVHDEVYYDVDAQAVRLVEQGGEVLQRAVLRVDAVVVRDVVLVIARRGHYGHEPDAVHAEGGDVVELFREAGEVAYPVAVAVVVGVDEDLVPVAVFVVDDVLLRLAPPLPAGGEQQQAECQEQRQAALSPSHALSPSRRRW